MSAIRPYIIVTVRSEKHGVGDTFDYDMEMPVNVQVGNLIEDILDVLSQYRNKPVSTGKGELFCARLNRSLYINETLESACVWNGDILILR